MLSSERRAFIAFSAAACLAYLSCWLQPFIVSAVIARTGASPPQAGGVLTIEFVALAAASYYSGRRVRAVLRRRVLLAGVAIALVGTAASVPANTYLTLLSARLLTGIGEGCVLMVSMAGIGSLPNPPRMYAASALVTNVSGVLLGFVMQTIGEHRHGLYLVFPLLLATQVILLPLLLLTPGSECSPTVNSPRVRGGMRLAALLGLVMLIVGTTNAVWAFYFQIGAAAGLNEQFLVGSIEYGLIAGSLGSLIASVIGDRFGRLLPLIIALAAQAGAIMLMSQGFAPAAFKIASAMYLLCSAFCMPFFLSFGAAERSGHASADVGATYVLASAASPFVGGILLALVGEVSTAMIIAVACLAGAIGFTCLESTRVLLTRDTQS
jgi:predicted MFS family arabinose efflux permease